jgi:hypothetical protein
VKPEAEIGTVLVSGLEPEQEVLLKSKEAAQH